jgi:hypothetical protein
VLQISPPINKMGKERYPGKISQERKISIQMGKYHGERENIMGNTTDLLQITDKLYHSRLYQVHLATGKVELTSLMGKVEREWKRMHK